MYELVAIKTKLDSLTSNNCSLWTIWYTCLLIYDTRTYLRDLCETFSQKKAQENNCEQYHLKWNTSLHYVCFALTFAGHLQRGLSYSMTLSCPKCAIKIWMKKRNIRPRQWTNNKFKTCRRQPDAIVRRRHSTWLTKCIDPLFRRPDPLAKLMSAYRKIKSYRAIGQCKKLTPFSTLSPKEVVSKFILKRWREIKAIQTSVFVVKKDSTLYKW